MVLYLYNIYILHSAFGGSENNNITNLLEWEYSVEKEKNITTETI